jgi:hypothetical protein
LNADVSSTLLFPFLGRPPNGHRALAAVRGNRRRKKAVLVAAPAQTDDRHLGNLVDATWIIGRVLVAVAPLVDESVTVTEIDHLVVVPEAAAK